VLVGGNTVVVVAGEASPLATVDLTGAPDGIEHRSSERLPTTSST
jgi:hypothetical protein